VTVLTVLVIASLFWCAGLTWQWEQIRDQDSRRPQAQIRGGLILNGATYATVRYYADLDGYDAVPEHMIEKREPVAPAKNGKGKK
jgi:hypothetical protein